MLMGTCSGEESRGGGEEFRVDCSLYTCGWDCAQAHNGKCGWSSQLMECRRGRKTKKKEWILGNCSDTSIRAAGKDPCNKHVCGRTCAQADGCGWSSKKGPNEKCVTGATTRASEYGLGNCPVDESAPPPQEEFCSQFVCGADCATAAPICGWNTKKMACKRAPGVRGGKTSAKQLVMGNCTGSTACERHPCARLCDNQAGCGWSTGKSRCTAGANTSPEEIQSTWCPGDSTSSTTATETTVTDTTVTDTTATETTITSTRTSQTVSTVTDTTVTTPTEKLCIDWKDANGNVWVDNDDPGDGCAAYEAEKWCQNGGYGPAWGSSGDTFADYAANGLNSGEACCVCGGGSANFMTEAPKPTHCCAGEGCCETGVLSSRCPSDDEDWLGKFVNGGNRKVIDLSLLLAKRSKGDISPADCAERCAKLDGCVAFQFKQQKAAMAYCEPLTVGIGDSISNPFWYVYEKINECWA